MKRNLAIILLIVTALPVMAQNKNADSNRLPVKMLDSIYVSALKSQPAGSLPDMQRAIIFAGKKTISIHPADGRSNLAQNLGRMTFSQIPGLNVWDMDGAGTQVNIGSRGTDAHRSIEMNMRQNGYNTNSDIFGYPEDHYTPPMQAISEIQFVRGSAALQFGSQFGGMMNYVLKEGDSSKRFGLESEQTYGSFNFFNSYNAIGGRMGKVSYFAYFDHRNGDGWRPNSAFNYNALYGNIKYRFSRRGSIALQFSRMNYRQQIAGGLTDAMFDENSRQSNRNRNFFNPVINIPALLFSYTLSDRTILEITSHMLFGQRNSVQFINTPDVPDTVNISLGTYNHRQVDRDYYAGFTTEARLLSSYKVGGMKSTLSTGLRFFDETTRRRQKGTGTTAANFDLALTAPYGIDLRFRTFNYALFAENQFRINDKLSLVPGFRFEVIDSKLSGAINNGNFPVSFRGERHFPLLGMGAQYQVKNGSQVYANVSQAYRPFLYANITPADQVGKIDPALRDTKGYDMDLGYRGHISNFMHFDFNLFYVYYGNRIGKITVSDNSGSYLLTTNTGNAVAKGVEAYVEWSPWNIFFPGRQHMDLRLFNSLAYDHARYTGGSAYDNGLNKALEGKEVEGAPEWIDRAGLIVQWMGLQSTLQFSYVSRSYSDATNTVTNYTGAVGIVPSYQVWDWSFSWNLSPAYHVSAGINNIGNAQYFTRRINMYPGPGILPADGRSFYVSLGLKI